MQVFTRLVRIELSSGMISCHGETMSLTRLTTADLKSIAKLIERKEALQAQIEEIDKQLDTYESGKALTTAAGKGKTRGRSSETPGKIAQLKGAPRNRRGSIEEGVRAALKQAGKAGMHVAQIAEKAQAKLPSVRMWFQTSAKKIKGIKKIAPATYRLEE